MAPPFKKLSPKAVKLFANDLKAYSKVCLRIRTKGGLDRRSGEIRPAEMAPLTFNESQDLVHEILRDQYQRIGCVRAIILKARQLGMSTYTSARFFRKLHLWPNQQAIVIADELDRSQTLFGMYDRYHAYLPDEMRPMVRYTSKKKEIIFDNPRDNERAGSPGLGSGISVETAGDTATGRGSTIQLAHLSEMGEWDNAEDVFVSLIQAVPDYESEVIIESTAKGVGNMFHRMWLAAEEGEGVTEGSNGFIAIFIPWWFHQEYTLKLSPTQRREIRDTLDEEERAYMEVGFRFRGETVKLTEGQIAWRRRTIAIKMQGNKRAFRQEYPATPEEAFLVSGSCFFDELALKDYELRAITPKRRAMLVEVGGGVVIRPSELGYLKIWDLPDEKSQYVIAADTASGREVAASSSSFSDPDSERGGRDFSSADVVDVVGRRQVAQLHGRMAPEVFADQLALLGRFYSSEQRSGLRTSALLAPEKNHHSGETVIKRLKERHRYPNLYTHRSLNRRFDKRTEMLGWVTTVETRMPMLDNLAALVRDGSFEIRSKDSLKEMATFVLGEDGKPQAQQGAHDDRVISLAIACYLMQQGGWEPPKHADEPDLLVTAGTSPTGMFTY